MSTPGRSEVPPSEPPARTDVPVPNADDDPAAAGPSDPADSVAPSPGDPAEASPVPSEVPEATPVRDDTGSAPPDVEPPIAASEGASQAEPAVATAAPEAPAMRSASAPGGASRPRHFAVVESLAGRPACGSGRPLESDPARPAWHRGGREPAAPASRAARLGSCRASHERCGGRRGRGATAPACARRSRLAQLAQRTGCLCLRRRERLRGWLRAQRPHPLHGTCVPLHAAVRASRGSPAALGGRRAS